MVCIMQNMVKEWSFCTHEIYPDHFNDVELEVVFNGPDGIEIAVPAFWGGGNIWRVRFSSSRVGEYHYRTICSDAASDLHGLEGDFEVIPYHGANSLFKHGPVQVMPDKRHLQHFDGEPFFWLADTWWMGLCQRLKWPGDFQALAMDRVKKGFNVVQIVAGLYPDMPPFDERGANEGGFPWEKDYGRINPAYFDFADRRIDYLVEAGLVPCIVGSWGCFLDFMGAEKMKKHWRYLIARYGAYPVIWGLAGEALNPYYLKYTSNEIEGYTGRIRREWTEIARFVRAADPYRRLVTIHPSDFGRLMVDDPSLLDFDMLQTGHGSHLSFPNTIQSLNASFNMEPKMPVLVSEVCYEGIEEASREEIQRLMFWTCILSGAAGHTYGANGIWQVNTKDKPYGSSPHGNSYGGVPWDEAAKLPGSGQLGIAKKLLERYSWWQFEPHPEWIGIKKLLPERLDGYSIPYAAGIPEKVRVIYFSHYSPFLDGLSKVKLLEPEVKYRAFFFNPSNGVEHNLGKISPDKKGSWEPPNPPIYRDWILVLEAG